MQLHQISSQPGNKSKKRIGRGGKLGTYSTRGIKGQKSRSGRKMRPEWRDALKSIPKKRGYKFKSIKTKPEVFNLSFLSKSFSNGETITPKSLMEKGLISKKGGRLLAVKILGGGELSKKLSFKGVEVSVSAKEAILKAGGTIS
jgi:large subunit ribosomal protein L15